MPPEQQFGEPVDRRSDVYAAGIVLWELLVGRRLFTARDEDELVRQMFEGRIAPPSTVAPAPVPRAIDHVVLRALSRKREDRWWSAEQMANALRDALEPASRVEVAAAIATIAREEIEQRAAHVQALQTPRAPRLEREAQTVLDVLTARGKETIPEPVPFAPATKVESPGARESARANAESRAARRAQRRAERRLRLILALVGIGLLLALLMVIALVLGRKTREAEGESPSVRRQPTTTPTLEPSLSPHERKSPKKRGACALAAAARDRITTDSSAPLRVVGARAQIETASGRPSGAFRSTGGPGTRV